jgi:hypothetical protein
MKPMQLLIAGPRMSDAVRCNHFANAVVQRKLIRDFQRAYSEASFDKAARPDNL